MMSVFFPLNIQGGCCRSRELDRLEPVDRWERFREASKRALILQISSRRPADLLPGDKQGGLEFTLLEDNGLMNTSSSSSEGYEHGHSFDTFLVRRFQAADQQQVMQLHAAAVPGGVVDCDCAAKIDEIEEKYFRRPQDHFLGCRSYEAGLCVLGQSPYTCMTTTPGAFALPSGDR